MTPPAAAPPGRQPPQMSSVQTALTLPPPLGLPPQPSSVPQTKSTTTSCANVYAWSVITSPATSAFHTPQLRRPADATKSTRITDASAQLDTSSSAASVMSVLPTQLTTSALPHVPALMDINSSKASADLPMSHRLSLFLSLLFAASTSKISTEYALA